MEFGADTIKIQIIASDPEVTSRENLEIEADQIEKSLALSGIKPIFNFFLGLSQRQIQTEIANFSPDIVHFSSIGSPHNKIRIYSNDGWIRNITGGTLSNLIFSEHFKPKCVFLNNSRVFRGESQISKFNIPVISIYHQAEGFDVAKDVAYSFYSAIWRMNSYDEAIEIVKSEFKNKYTYNFNFKIYHSYFSSHVISKMYSKDKILYSIAIDQEKEACEALRKFSGAKKSFFVESEPMGPREYRVWFGTNREPVDRSRSERGFGGDRSSVVRYGYCDVVIPKYHDIGSLGEPWWKRFPLFWRNNRLQVTRREVVEVGEYWAAISQVFESLSNEDRSLLIFLHGFNVDFDQAAIRAAQLGFDLSVRGATAFFSWPSKGSIKGYAADVASVEASEEYIAKFISDMVDFSGADKVHLIAHSMGNRGLLRAFSSAINSATIKMKRRLNQIFLAAPDVDVDLFKRLANVYSTFSHNTTMYISSKDRALKSSGIIHDKQRAGFSPPITIVPNIDTIEVSKIDLTFLGHSYIGEARSVLADMHTLMETNTPASKRFGLDEMMDGSGLMYWQIKS